MPRKTNKSGLGERANDAIVEVSSKPGRQVELTVQILEEGCKVTAKTGEVIEINGNLEYVIGRTDSALTILAYDGDKTIILGRRALNLGRIRDFNAYLGYIERITPHRHKKYNQYASILRGAGIYPN
ncbi:hypothetical protein GF386_02140 [Candidatus Pacearchaeota archaeon]|nr:hypothetical protein [Candidatus Pacearchaeota archaeon]MBD3282968.1 hypothetical protein [Candidatus Pacearchaeota archaeon]